MLTRKAESIEVKSCNMVVSAPSTAQFRYQLHLADPISERAAPATVFVIDHDAAVRDALTITLRSTGFSVITFASAGAFLKSLPITEEGCLLIEFDLEDMTGAEFISRLADERIDLPAIIMSARLRPPVLAETHRSRVRAILQKPFGQSELLQCLRSTFEGR